MRRKALRGGKFNYRLTARVVKALEPPSFLQFPHRSNFNGGLVKDAQVFANLRVLNQTQKVFQHKYLNFNTIFRNFSRVATPSFSARHSPRLHHHPKHGKFSSAHFFHSLKHLRGGKHEISLPFLVIRLMLSLAKHQNVITAKLFPFCNDSSGKRRNSPSLEERTKNSQNHNFHVVVVRPQGNFHAASTKKQRENLLNLRCRGNATLGVKLRHIYICEEGVYTKHPSLAKETRIERLGAAAAWVDG